jgi:hypothetical protein
MCTKLARVCINIPKNLMHLLENVCMIQRMCLYISSKGSTLANPLLWIVQLLLRLLILVLTCIGLPMSMFIINKLKSPLNSKVWANFFAPWVLQTTTASLYHEPTIVGSRYEPLFSMTAKDSQACSRKSSTPSHPPPSRDNKWSLQPYGPPPPD